MPFRATTGQGMGRLRYLICPICFNARHLDDGGLVANATLGGTVPMWEWIGDEPATTFSY